MGTVAEDPVPLARLFAMAFGHLIENLHVRLAEQGWHDVRQSYGFVLLGVRDRALTTTEIAALLGTTKQAASKLVTGMENAGYVVHRAHPEDSRAKLVALTRRGERLLAAVEKIYADLEAEWSGLVGTRQVETMRKTLTAALRATHNGTLPPIRPTT